LELSDGVTPLAVTGGLDWLAVGDEGVWLYGAAPQPVSVLAPRSADDEVVTLTAEVTPGNHLFAATRDRIDLLDRATESVQEVAATPSTRILDVVAATGEAVLLLADDRDPAQPALRLAQLTLPAEGEPVLSAPSEQALPLLAAASLQRTAGFLHLLGIQQDGKGVIYTWPETAPGEPLTATPQVFEVAAGWRGTGAWENGAVILDGTAVALLEHGTSGWSEVGRVDLGAEAAAAAVTGNALVVVLPGEVRVYDVTNPADPVLSASHPGASYREVEPLAGGDVLLWSPRMAAPPLRFSPTGAVPGNGFLTVIDGLP
jgi:hypothetical protein